MPIDKKLISRKITLINGDLKSLKGLNKLSLKIYLSNAEYETLAERYLERIIGRMIDINYHILSWVPEWNRKIQSYATTLSFKGIGNLILACSEDLFKIFSQTSAYSVSTDFSKN